MSVPEPAGAVISDLVTQWTLAPPRLKEDCREIEIRRELAARLVATLEPKQAVAMFAPATEVLFGGAAGPGKSYAARVRSCLLAILFPLQQFFFRRQSKELRDHIDGPGRFPEMLEPLQRSGQVEAVAGEFRFFDPDGDRDPNRAGKIKLRHFNDRGHAANLKEEMNAITVDEAGDFYYREMLAWLRTRNRLGQQFARRLGSTPEQSAACLSAGLLVMWQGLAADHRRSQIAAAEADGEEDFAARLRRSLAKIEAFEMPPYSRGQDPQQGPQEFYERLRAFFLSVLPGIFYTANPGGIAHAHLKSGWVDPAPPMTVFRAPKEDGGMLRCFIPAVASDNPHQDDDYLDKLSGSGSPELVRALREGDWNIAAGGYFASFSRPLYDGEVEPACVIAAITPPPSWRIVRAFDMGISDPWACIWCAISDGTALGKDWYPPRGSIYLFAELYGNVPGEVDVGNRLPVHEIAAQILEMEHRLGIAQRVKPGPADGIFAGARTDPAQRPLHKIMEGVASPAPGDDRIGVRFLDAAKFKFPGSRAQGWAILASMLGEHYKEHPEQKLFIVADTCRDFLRTLFDAPIDPAKPDDILTSCEDHLLDAARYVVLMAQRQSAPSLEPGMLGKVKPRRLLGPRHDREGDWSGIPGIDAP